MSKRFNIGFYDGGLFKAVNSFAKQNGITKSRFIESTIQNYFVNNKNRKITPNLDGKQQKKNQLNITFKNEELAESIEKYAKKHALSKSNFIEYVLQQFFLSQKDTTTLEKNCSNNELKKYFEKDFGKSIYIEQMAIKNASKKTKLIYGDCIDYRIMDIELRSDNVSLAHLNKIYSEKIKFEMILKHANINDKFDNSGFCYIVLVGEVKLILKKIIYQEFEVVSDDEDKECKTSKSIPISGKNKNIYLFRINYAILKIGKIVENEINLKRYMRFIPFDKNAVLEQHSKYIDISSIEYVAKARQKLYQKTSNYYRLLPSFTKNKGCYYVKLLDKPKAISQFLKKGHVYKIDKRFIISQIPKAKKEKLLNQHISIVNILPILEYTTPKNLKETICLKRNNTKP